MSSLVFSKVLEEREVLGQELAGLRHRWKGLEQEQDLISGDLKDGKAPDFQPCAKSEKTKTFFLRWPLPRHHDFKVLIAATHYLVLVETFHLGKYN